MKRMLTAGLGGGLIGAVAFWLYQTVFQGGAITGFIGAQIVRQGHYSLPPTLVGWAVHLGVSFSYGLLIAVVAQIPFTDQRALNRAVSFAAAIVLGVATTIIAPPAIQITISLLAGKGLPASLWGLNPVSGHPLWVHLLFFAVVWLVDAIYEWISPDDAPGLFDAVGSFLRGHLAHSGV